MSYVQPFTFTLSLKKKDICLPFSNQPKMMEGSAYFFKLNFAFFNKNVQIKC